MTRWKGIMDVTGVDVEESEGDDPTHGRRPAQRQISLIETYGNETEYSVASANGRRRVTSHPAPGRSGGMRHSRGAVDPSPQDFRTGPLSTYLVTTCAQERYRESTDRRWRVLCGRERRAPQVA